MNLETITVVLTISIPFFFLTIWAIVDAARKNFGTIKEKALWVVIASIPFIGFLIYLILGFRKGKKPVESK
ncbi:MAG: PLDc N-terminal domain-containing protein [Deltaproteobacteria bacterium]|nr:PLDc N-terminal domain-containing protein [Deltaproteobacteria bacterium]MBW2662470.1 PLDc N-terminal domain-containing protein [Deltaproteobacteria bacterium]